MVSDLMKNIIHLLLPTNEIFHRSWNDVENWLWIHCLESAFLRIGQWETLMISHIIISLVPAKKFVGFWSSELALNVILGYFESSTNRELFSLAEKRFVKHLGESDGCCISNFLFRFDTDDMLWPCLQKDLSCFLWMATQYNHHLWFHWNIVENSFQVVSEEIVSLSKLILKQK